MPRTTTMIVRVCGVLNQFIAATVDEAGASENLNLYIRVLIQCDRKATEREAF